MSDEATVINEAKRLAWPDRIAHPNWKVRSAAFDDINVACNGVYDENDPCLHEFGGNCLWLVFEGLQHVFECDHHVKALQAVPVRMSRCIESSSHA